MTLRVLCVDDDADTRLLVQLVLEGSGRFDVVGGTGDAFEATDLARDRQPDLVLLDLSMPGLDGLATLPLLRDAAPDSKIIVYSGLPPSEAAAAALAGGAVGFLEKRPSFRGLVDEVLALGGILEVVARALAEARANLAAEPQSASAARRFVDQTLARWDCAEMLDVVSLLISELVTNAVVHAASPVEVAVRLLPDAVRFEVVDTAGGTPVLREAAEDDQGGRGLALVDALARSWGVEEREQGKSVWFEVARPDRPSPVSQAGKADATPRTSGNA